MVSVRNIQKKTKKYPGSSNQTRINTRCLYHPLAEINIAPFFFRSCYKDVGKIKTGLTAWKAAAIGVCGNKAGFFAKKKKLVGFRFYAM